MKQTAVTAAMPPSKVYYSFNKGKKDLVEGYREYKEREGREVAEARIQLSKNDMLVIAD